MWPSWISIKSWLGKFSVTALLREQLALSEAKVAKLETEKTEFTATMATLTAELKQTQTDLCREKRQHQQLKDEHKEEIKVWKTVEFRKGKRTFGRWEAFCPKCHLPLFVSPSWESNHVSCSADCGWKPDIDAGELEVFLGHLAKQGD